jgi:hypothetical protein
MANAEFLVHDIHVTDDKACVSGIANKGAPATGAVFTSYRNTYSETCPANFKITKIIAYRNSIEILPKGMSGELYLEGAGLEHLKKHFMLEL